jgi:ornithine cyclodeaminase/alanine dehydrogenase-like protein (mu-crystallin family)
MKIRLLSRDDVRRALAMERAIDLMEDAFTSLSKGDVQAPVRTNVSHSSGTMLYKPAFMPTARMFGLKAVSVFPENVAKGLPATTGVMLVNDSDTGLPLALLDAQYLTALRTGAAAGLATRQLANTKTRVAALFGTGGQARCQLEALLQVLNLDKAYIISRQSARADSFCEEHAELAGSCRLIPADSTEVLAECGVITTATTSSTPLFADDALSDGVHLNGIGSFAPNMAEIPPETVCRATVYVDQREAALKEAGDLIGPLKAGLLPSSFSPAELGEVLLGTRPGRCNQQQITFFKSVGNAAQDIVCAADILATANREGLGQMVEL